jgi:hypothetical protein
MNFDDIITRIDPAYKDRIDIMLINTSGVAEYSTNKKTYTLISVSGGRFF